MIWWHFYRTSRRRDRSVLWPSQHGWTYNQVNYGTGVKWFTCLPGHLGHPPFRWISIHISIQEEDPHGPISWLYFSPPPDEQSCRGQDTDDPSGQDLHICARQRQGEETHCQGPEEQRAPLTTCERKLVHSTQSPPKFTRGPTKSHGSDPLRPAPLRVHPTYPSPATGSYLLPATLHTQADASEPEGPDTTQPTGRSDLRGPMWWLSTSVCWPDGENTEPQTERAQKSPDKGEPDPVCPGWTCGCPWSCHWVGKFQGCWCSPPVPTDVSVRILAHPVPRCHPEPGGGKTSPGVQPTNCQDKSP